MAAQWRSPGPVLARADGVGCWRLSPPRRIGWLLGNQRATHGGCAEAVLLMSARLRRPLLQEQSALKWCVEGVEEDSGCSLAQQR